MESRLKEPLWALAGSAAVFAAVMLLAYLVGPAGRIDATALNGLMALDGRVTGSAASLAANSANPLPLLAMLAGVVALGLYWRRPRQTAAAVAVVAGANVTAQVLKVLLAHPRYQPVLGTDQLGPVAFPSGHATAAMSIAVAFAIVAPREVRPLAALLGAGYSLAVGISVTVLGWHYPSDVVGGMLVATGFGFAALAGLSLTERHRPSPPRPGTVLAPEARRGLLEATGLGICAVAMVLALSRAGEIFTYARAHTIAVAVAFGIAVFSLTLVGVLTALSRE
ncbi:MAG: phosphatase PAP2 family protein [Solirubrobacterales bacterium]